MRIIFIALLLSGCSYFQYLPTSNCHKIDYKRVGGNIVINAECAV